jgi:co-chaperonin GroES (HSP10)
MFGENPPTRWVVVATGEWYMTESGITRPMELVVWDIVYFMKHSWAPLHKRQEDGTISKYWVVRYSSILAKE